MQSHSELRSYCNVHACRTATVFEMHALVTAVTSAIKETKIEYARAYHDFLSNMYLPLGIVRDVKWETTSSMVDPFLPIIARGSMDIINMVYSEDDSDQCGVKVSCGWVQRGHTTSSWLPHSPATSFAQSFQYMTRNSRPPATRWGCLSGRRNAHE